jgi:hypothetical protein
MHDEGLGAGLLVTVKVPSTDFAAVWAALRLDRVPTLECEVERETNKVLQLRMSSQGSLFPLFGV